jgi:hypothetical protein
MIKITRNFFISKEDLNIITNNLPSKHTFTLSTSYLNGSVGVEVTLNMPEEFRLTEDALQTILEGLFPALDEPAIEQKAELVKNHLRSIGATL